MNKVVAIIITIPFIFSLMLPIYAGGESLDKAGNEHRIGHLFDFYMTESFLTLRDEMLSVKIQEVVDRIVTVTEKPQYKLQLRILNERLPVAASFPGYVYLSSGMLDILNSEDELASMIAHAVAHVIASDQHQSYSDALRDDQIAYLTGHLMPFLVFSGVGAAAITVGGLTYASASSVGTLLIAESGIVTASLATQALQSSASPVDRTSIIKLGPYLDVTDTKARLSVLAFFEEIYRGYGSEKELEADRAAVHYLHAAGYNPEAISEVMKRLLELRSDNINRGLIYHMLVAGPGLEKRIDIANEVLKSYR